MLGDAKEGEKLLPSVLAILQVKLGFDWVDLRSVSCGNTGLGGETRALKGIVERRAGGERCCMIVLLLWTTGNMFSGEIVLVPMDAVVGGGAHMILGSVTGGTATGLTTRKCWQCYLCLPEQVPMNSISNLKVIESV